MPRGKHGQAAAVRQEVQTRDAEIETYKNAVARLTAETKALKDRLQAMQSEHSKEIRRVRALMEAGTSPKVQALEIRLEEWAEKDRQRRAGAEKQDKLWRTAFHNMLLHFEEVHKVPKVEAMELVIQILDYDGWSEGRTFIGDMKHLDGLAPDDVRVLQRIRGDRR